MAVGVPHNSGLAGEVVPHPSAHVPERRKPAYSRDYVTSVRLRLPETRPVVRILADMVVEVLNAICFLGAYSPSWIGEAWTAPKDSFVSAFWRGRMPDVIFARYIILLESLMLAVGPARKTAGRIASIATAHMYKPEDDRLEPIAMADDANAITHVTIWDDSFKPGLLTLLTIYLNKLILVPLLTFIMLISPRFYHAFVAHLAAALFKEYTRALNISGSPGKRLAVLMNVPAPRSAVKYYGLQGDAKMGDLLLFMRADAAYTASLHASLVDNPSGFQASDFNGPTKREE